ncbi:MAG: hypothetical protein ABI638_11960 [Ignavibacteriota bacterium]
MALKIDPQKKNRLILIIGSIAFLFNGWDSLDQNNYLLAGCNFLLAFTNIVSLYFIKDKATTINLVLFLLNSFLAFIIAFNYLEVGKKGLPIVWALVGFIYIILALSVYKKTKQSVKT